ncbi:MAG: DUF2203 domain-containing protein [Thermoplasmata archaeon]|nr:DUF2203 domain-containing protein [Thermoplasmata archaeon]
MPIRPDREEPPLPKPARLWTVPEANARLDELRELLPQLRAWVVRLRRLQEQLQRLTAFWQKEIDAIDNPDHELRGRLHEEWQSLTKKLEEEVGRLQEEGIEVKDLETGLIDFYGLVEGEIVCLCWRRGEDEVGFYHTVEGGFRNRRPLPAPAATPAISGRRGGGSVSPDPGPGRSPPSGPR